jgi:hypothetical protein
MFRNIGLALAVACMGLASRIADDLAYAIAPMLRYVSYGCEAMACGVEKLKRELVHVFAQDPHQATGFGEGLSRDSHGFRQSSAFQIGAEERTALAC